MPKPAEFLAASHPALLALFYGVAALYAVAWLLGLIRPRWAPYPLAAGALAHVAVLVWRGAIIGYLPMTNKHESFSSAALAIALVALLSWQPSRAYATTLLTALVAATGASLAFSLDMNWPPPLLRTVWYVLHVPLSFVAYATWAAAAAAGLAWFANRADLAWLARIDRLALWGFALWSISMIFGGIWGVVAWGAYFLWDPKVIWSVLLWFFYATFVHVRLTPSLLPRTWVRPALAVLGLVFVFVAYVGTSFFFGRSTHAF